MFCTRCGARNDDSAKFCSQCGASLTDVTWTVREQDPEPPVAEAPQAEVPTASEPEVESAPEPEVEVEPAPASEDAPEPEPEPGPEPDVPESEPASPVSAPEPPESWGEPVTEVPPQEWPDGAAQSPFQEGGKPKKGLGTGAIVGIIVAGFVVVALIVVAVLFVGSSSGGGADDPATREEPSENVEIEGFGEGLGALGGGSDADPDPDPDPDAIMGDEIDGSVFDLACYEGTPAEIEEFLLASGLTVSGSWASDGSGITDPYVSLTFSGEYDGAAPIETEAGRELEVSVQAYLGSTPVTWDDLGYADDAISSLNDLADDAEISGIAIEFYSPVEPAEFASAAGSIFSSMELPAATRVSASSDDILSSTLDELGVGEDRGDVTDYLGEVLFVDSESMPFRDGEGSCQVSLMGGEEFGGVTMVEIDLS